MFKFILPVLIFSFQAQANENLFSWTEIHGGDATAIEALVQVSQISLDVFNAAYAAGLNREFASQFQENLKLHLGEFYGTNENLLVDGQTKTALNRMSKTDPARKDIFIQNLLWGSLSQESRYRLILHELLLVAGYKDLDYSASLKLFAYLQCVDIQSKNYQEYYKANSKQAHRDGVIFSEYVKLYCGSFNADFQRF